MPPVGKLSSVLAQFEQTIEQNNAAGVASGMYLTKLASSSKDSLPKSRGRSNNTLSTSSSHSSKKLVKELSSRSSRSSYNNKDKSAAAKRSEPKPQADKKDWNSYLENTATKKALLRDDDSSVSEISQGSFGFDEIVPFEDPFQENAGTSDDFNPFGLDDDVPQPKESNRKPRPPKEKRGIGRLGNRTTKAKLDVKAAKKINSKGKAVDDNNDDECENVHSKNGDDDDESEESGNEPNITLIRNGRSNTTTSRATIQRGESFRRSKNADLDRNSTHGAEQSQNHRQFSNKQQGESFRRNKNNDLDRQSSHSNRESPDRQRQFSNRQQQKEIHRSNNKENDDDGSTDDGFSLTYVAKRDGIRNTIHGDENCHSRKNNTKSSAARGLSSSCHNQTPIATNSSNRRDTDVTCVSGKSKTLHTRPFMPIDRYDDYEERCFRENDPQNNDTETVNSKSSYQTSESIHSRVKSMHTRKPLNTLDPTSAQSRFFGGNGESKVKVRTRPINSSGSSSNAILGRTSNLKNENNRRSSNNDSNILEDQSEHSKHSYVSNTSTKGSRRLQMVKKIPNGNHITGNNSSSQLNYYE